MKQIFISILFLLSIGLYSQNKTIPFKVMFDEDINVAQLADHLNINYSLIKKWNSMAGNDIPAGREILLKLPVKYDFELIDIEFRAYQFFGLLKEQETLTAPYKSKVDSLDKVIDALDQSNQKELQKVFEFSRVRTKYKDSIKVIDNRYNVVVDEMAEVYEIEPKMSRMIWKASKQGKLFKPTLTNFIKFQDEVSVEKEPKIRKLKIKNKDVESPEIVKDSVLSRKDLKKIKKQEKDDEEFIKEFIAKDTLDIDTNLFIPTVTIVQKRKDKHGIGQEVPKSKQEKSMFYLERAKLEIDKENFKQAKKFIDKSILLFADNIEARMMKGDLYAFFESYKKAIKEYQIASLITDTNVQLNYNIGACLQRIGKDKNALEYYDKALNQNKDYVYALMGRSLILFETREYDKALKDYNRILKQNRFFIPAYKGKALSQFYLGMYEKAIKSFNEYLVFEPDDAEAYFNRGMSKYNLDNIYDGCVDFLQAQEMGFDDAKKTIKQKCE